MAEVGGDDEQHAGTRIGELEGRPGERVKLGRKAARSFRIRAAAGPRFGQNTPRTCECAVVQDARNRKRLEIILKSILHNCTNIKNPNIPNGPV